MTIKDAQLSSLNPDEVLSKAALGLALNLKELAIATGYSYSKVRAWKDLGLPLMDGRITLKEATAWRRKAAKSEGLRALEKASGSKTGRGSSASSFYKSYGPNPKHGSPDPSPSPRRRRDRKAS